MNNFESKVKKFIHKHRLIPPGSRVLAGVSGGPDSLALLYFLHKHRNDMNIEIMVAHVDHMLRGEQSYRELKYVEEICRKWKVPFEGKRIDVGYEARKSSKSIEVAAREQRYKFFKEVMEKHNFPLLALAHHGDDQIETILMRLTRGAEQKALAGIRIQRPLGIGHVIRPLLCVTKDEIEQYIKENNLKPVYDHTNYEDIYTRNRFRLHILPFLKKENPNVHIHFQQFSERLIDDENYLMDLASRAYTKVVRINNKNEQTVNIAEFKKLPSPLQRRCIQLILEKLYEGKKVEDLSSVHIQLIMDLMERSHPSGRIDLPENKHVYRSYGECIFSTGKIIPDTYIYEWNKGETITLPNGNQLVMKSEDKEIEESNDTFRLGPETTFPLYVRTRKPGDRIRLKGMNGRKKIKSIFIDSKIPRPERDEWPIVTDRHGNILWVPSLKKSSYEHTGRSDRSIILQYIKTD